jgi:hypothetical protein
VRPTVYRSRPRSRAVQAALVAITIVLGLASRRYAAHLPSWLAKNAGDALYATMMFWGIGLLAPRISTLGAALGAAGLCFAIEASQLYHAPGIDAVRATRLGALVLGSGFHALDLLCYVIGVVVAAGIELTARRA